MISSSFKENLRHWSFHVSFNAIPSFVIAAMTMWKSAASWAAMIVGVLFYIAVLTLVTSTKAYSDFTRLEFLSDAMRFGKRARIVVASIAIFGLAMHFIGARTGGSSGGVVILFYLPDMYAGLIAFSIAEKFLLTGVDTSGYHFGDSVNISAGSLFGDIGSFFPTLSIVLIEGAILLCAMVAIGLFCSAVKCFVYALKRRNKESGHIEK